MSRVAKKPVELVNGAKATVNGEIVTVEGKGGKMELVVNNLVNVTEEDGLLVFKPKAENKASWAMAGTMRSLVNNMVVGVTDGFEKKLILKGVGYRAAVQGKNLNLTLGYSHPIDFEIPEGITVSAPSQTELVVTGSDKQLVGQVSAKIRSFRPPEPYKGKGVRYADEHVVLKEAKKK